MTDIELLEQMIKDEAKVALEDKYGKRHVTLIDPQCPGGFVAITGVPDNAIVIKADSFKAPDSIFTCEKGECKRADFVIVADSGQKKVILCIEMKQTKDSAKEVVQQLTGTLCFISYCKEIGRLFWKNPDFLKDYEYRFVSIGHLSIDIRKTEVTREAGIHDRPDRMMKIRWPNRRTEFNKLVGKSK